MTQDHSKINISENEIRHLVEIGLDRDLTDFSMALDWYDSYAMDSLGAIALAVEVRKRYRLKIPTEQMPSLRNGNQLKHWIESELKPKPCDGDPK